MLNTTLVPIVDFCARHRWLIIAGGLLLAIFTTAYDVTAFSITTDVEALISKNLPWHQRQLAYFDAFPQMGISAVVQGPTPENTELATNALAQRLADRKNLFRTVVQPDSGAFFERNGLLFMPLPELNKSIDKLTKARPIIAALATDPSLRGALKALSSAAEGVRGGAIKLDELVWPLSRTAQTLSDVLAGKPATFSWQELAQRGPPQPDQLRHFIEIQPNLDFSALQPGRVATDGVRHVVSDLNLDKTLGAEVGLTGQVVMNDDQFATIRTSAFKDTFIALFGVLFVLWLALRSWKIIAAVFFSLLVGLASTAALGLAMVGSFNLLSIAFFVLFVGLGVDFGIQFSVRYRSERHDHDNLREALRSTALKVAAPLTLAAAATALGFFSFVPTSYIGLSELGLIAGCGMLIAFLCSITLVPAMLAVLDPPGEPARVGFSGLAPLDSFLQRHRIEIIAGTIIPVLAATPLFLHLPFDFNPVDLQNPNVASVKIYHELQKNPETRADDVEVLAKSADEAAQIAQRLQRLPEVLRVRTLANLVPSDVTQKLAAIKATSRDLDAALNPAKKEPAPSDQDLIVALRTTAADLSTAGKTAAPGADAARRVSELLTRLAQSDVTKRQAAEAAIIPPLNYDLTLLQRQLDPQDVTVKSLPSDLIQQWVLPDGRARVEAVPKGDTKDLDTLRSFATAALASEPSATGPAISDYESGKTITYAFIEAGILALAAISILLLIVLRRLSDVLLTLVPLILAGAVTLEICSLSHFALNFANIIALPLLLGVGVAFKIYYVMAWRAGQTGLLQSTLTRAVIFSAMTNAVAFGSMWSSNYPGLSSMGKMMALALLCTLASAVLFQPVLMGRPRQIRNHSSPTSHVPAAGE
jgi:hopanoid biosynthesis associated RND transporter like protein HpnN